MIDRDLACGSCAHWDKTSATHGYCRAPIPKWAPCTSRMVHRDADMPCAAFAPHAPARTRLSPWWMALRLGELRWRISLGGRLLSEHRLRRAERLLLHWWTT